MVKHLASKLLRVPILDDESQRIGRLSDILVETRTGNLTYLVIDKVDSQTFLEIVQQLPTGESVIPVSVAKLGDDSVIVDAKKLKLLSLKKSLKKRAFLAKSAGTSQTGESPH
ncbi:MAG: PRC-barrel domain-containing protein [Promethearchaeati archaeon SRVP18_Atabeyarchaeia-1]